MIGWMNTELYIGEGRAHVIDLVTVGMNRKRSLVSYLSVIYEMITFI